MRILTVPQEVADQPNVLGELTAVPAPSDIVCLKCHTWKSRNVRWCENCEEIHAVLGALPLSVSFVTLYAKPSRLRDWLTHYKGRPGSEDPWEREAEDVVEALIARFLVEYGSRVVESMGPIDQVVVVPSTDRLPPHPLELVLDRLGLDVPISREVHRTAEPIGFRQPNADAYRAGNLLSGQRVLLIDDVYTTGAHLNSTAAAVRQVGGIIAGGLVLARRINPRYRDEAKDLWQTANRVPFTWATGPYIAGENT